MLKVAQISAMALILWASAVSAWAAAGSSKAVFAYGAINAYMTTTWVAREQIFSEAQRGRGAGVHYRQPGCAGDACR